MRGPERRIPAVVAALVGAAMILACCGAPRVTATTDGPARVTSDELLSVGDIGAGWTTSVIHPSGVQPCSSPPTTGSIVGIHGSAVAFVGPGGTALVEFAVATNSLTDAYIAAVRRLQTEASCSQTTDGHPSSSQFDQVLSLPRYGNDSVAMLMADDDDGTLTQAGYDVVRRGHDLLVVGYDNPGSLDTAALQEYTAAALAKLPG